MKRRLTFGLLALAALGLVLQAQAQTAPEILAKMIEAQGGRAALAAVKDTTMSGSFELIQQGMSATITMYQKEPNKVRMDIEVMGMLITQAFDGEKGWWINPQTQTAEDMPEKQSQAMKLQALGNEALLNPDKNGIIYTFKGKEKVGDKDCFVLEQGLKDGVKALLYIDAATYLTYKSKSKTEMNGAEIETETIMSDYKKINGMMIPHAMVIFQAGAEFGRMNFSKAAFNTGIEDSFFKMK